MSLLDDKPTEEHIRALHEHTHNDPGIELQRKLDRRILALYFDKNRVETDDTASQGRKRSITPERATTGETSRIINLLLSFYTEPPKAGVQFSGEGSRTQAVGEKVAQGINEGIDQLNTITNTPWSDGVWWQLLLGRRADLIVSGDKYYHDFPKKTESESEAAWDKRWQEFRRKAPLPVMWITLPADQTWAGSLSGMDEAISERQVTFPELEDMFSASELPDDLTAEDKRKKFTLIIYSNRMWLTYMLAAPKPTGGMHVGSVGVGGSYKDHILRNVEHDMGRCAIRILPGLTTGSKEYPNYYRSIVADVVGSLEDADKFLTIARTSGKYDAYPLLVETVNMTVQQEGEGAEPEIRQFNEGDIVSMNAGDPSQGVAPETLKAVFQPQHGEQIRELLIWTLERIARRTGAVEVLEGAFGPPGMPAWSKKASSDFARGKLAPLTSRVIGAFLDIAETISAAVIAFGEPIALAKLDNEGDRKGTIMLDPKELDRFRPVLKGTYEPKIEQSRFAEIDLLGQALAQAKQNGAPSQLWLMQELGGIDDPWKHWRENIEFQHMTSDEVIAIQRKDIVQQFEASIEGDEGMTLAELEGKPEDDLPANVREMLLARARGQAPDQAASQEITPATAGALNAAQPFNRPPGGAPVNTPPL